MMTRKLLLAITIMTSFGALAQTPSQRARITASYDQDEAKQIMKDLEDKKVAKEQAVAQYLEANPNFSKSTISGAEEQWFERIDQFGQPVILIPDNFNGGMTIGVQHLHSNGSLGLEIEGQGIEAGIWDGGYSLATHDEMNGRVIYGEPGKTISGHGTHVGGTMISAGENDGGLKGMAPQGQLKSYEFDNDEVEMFTAASNGMLISNHSYGRLVSENTEVAVFGKYDESARGFDAITSFNEFYLPVVSAGNDNGKGLNRFDNGYDLLTDRTLAKNVVTVGAVNGIFIYNDESDVQMSSFSSWGPTDDGRIKPDLVAKGVAVRSLGSSSDDASATLQGTSMSSPMVSGGFMLLQQLYQEENGAFMKAATLKGLALMTTKEAGTDPGPDYRFGWGLLDVEAAGKMILNRNISSHFEESQLLNGETISKSFVARTDEELVFALSWTDIAGQPSGPDEDDPTPVLVNDLDIKVISENGTEYYPYNLDPSDFLGAAFTGVNSVDPIEIIKIDKPSGVYTVEITHKNAIQRTRQNFSLLSNGATESTASNSQQDIASLSVYPNPADNFFNVTFSSGIDGREVDINVFNSLGQQVISRTFDNSGSFNERVSTQGLSSGLYVVQIGDGDVSTTRKLIIR